MINAAVGSVDARRDGTGASLIDAIAIWCESLQGERPLATALRALAEGLDARAVVLSRHARGAGGGSARALVHDTLADAPGRGVEAVTRSYARSVLGPYLDRPRIASVWFASLAEAGDDPSLAEFQRRARIVETAVIPLVTEEKWVDFLEVHLASRAPASTQARLNLVADTLSRTWAKRRGGLFAEAMLSRRTQRDAGDAAAPLLGSANPARLSRAEFRICVLMTRGLSIQAVQDELAISRSTLKSHLRSIFAKTDTASQSELLYHLLAPAVRAMAGSFPSQAQRA